jgi:hypothetical protein
MLAYYYNSSNGDGVESGWLLLRDGGMVLRDGGMVLLRNGWMVLLRDGGMVLLRDCGMLLGNDVRGCEEYILNVRMDFNAEVFKQRLAHSMQFSRCDGKGKGFCSLVWVGCGGCGCLWGGVW